MSLLKSEELFSKLSLKMDASSVREILKVIQKPDVISLAGGMPDPATFPVEEIKNITLKILQNDSARALQYSSTEGLVKLREFLLNWLEFKNKKPGIDNIIITSGSQQGLDLVSKALLDPGDVVLVELPSYLAALNTFRSYGAEMIGIPMDEEGIVTGCLEDTLRTLTKKKRKVKFLYTISNFQNPAGVTMSLLRRKKTLEIARRYNIFILEDNPYDKLRYQGEALPSIFSLDSDERVISLGTFSKILCPGLRLAWLLGNDEIIEKIATLKQNTDLCTPMLNQLIASEYCYLGKIDENIKNNISIYKRKRDVMLQALQDYFPSEAQWTKPQGGFFVFVTLPETIDTDELFAEAIKEKVAYVSGSSFFVNGEGKNTMRLSFCYPGEQEIIEGIRRLGNVLSKKLTGLI